MKKIYALKNLHRNLVESPRMCLENDFPPLGLLAILRFDVPFQIYPRTLRSQVPACPACCRSLDNWVAALIIVGIFFLQGWFMANVSSVIKIASRSTKGRPAPATWAFFTPDSVQADLLRTAPTISKLLSHPLGTSIGG